MRQEQDKPDQHVALDINTALSLSRQAMVVTSNETANAEALVAISGQLPVSLALYHAYSGDPDATRALLSLEPGLQETYKYSIMASAYQAGLVNIHKTPQDDPVVMKNYSRLQQQYTEAAKAARNIS